MSIGSTIDNFTPDLTKWSKDIAAAIESLKRLEQAIKKESEN